MRPVAAFAMFAAVALTAPRPVEPFPAAEGDAAWAKLPRENPPRPPWDDVKAAPGEGLSVRAGGAARRAARS